MKKASEAAEVGVVIGRFQVPNLHEVHKELIQGVVNDHPRVVIFLGLAPLKTTRVNPLDYQSRKRMIETEFPDVEIHYIEDCKEDKAWAAGLDRQINRILGPGQSVVLYGSRDSFIKGYAAGQGKHRTIELVADRVVSGTEIRKTIGIKSQNDPKFRSGIIHATCNQFPCVFPTVDVAIVDEGKGKLLLCRKSTETKLRFVGGFADPEKDDSFEAAVKREVLEETGLEAGDLTYIGSKKIKDWRYRNEKNKIVTSFFYTPYSYGAAVANDDIAEVQWVEIATFDIGEIVEEHEPLLKMFLDFMVAKNTAEMAKKGKV